jgi:pyruvate dehydrogenase E2 component (dihydrolipoamide acetyltransferase)
MRLFHSPFTIHYSLFRSWVMAKEVIMPALGMAQETGTLLTWHKQPGDTVTKGELLMTVATDKTDVEIEANATGVLAQVTAAEGDEVPVGQVIALILTPEEAAAGVGAPPAKQPAIEVAPGSPVPTATPVAARLAAERGVDLGQIRAGASGKIQKEDVLAFLAAQAANPPTGGNGRPLASPKARRLARESAIDLAALRGSGPAGAILAADVLAARQQLVAAVQPANAPVEEVPPSAPVLPVSTPPAQAVEEAAPLPMSRLWRVMAQRLQQSWQTVPHFYLEREVNATALLRWRETAQARTTAKVTVSDLLVKLVAAALRKHPRANASWLNEEIVPNPEINIGLAVAVEEGLLVPVIHRADRLGLQEIATRRAEIVERAQSSKLTPDDLSGGTFTISNLGMFGIDKFNAIVNPPQAAILAVGRIADRVVPVDGQPSVQPMMALTLSCDHRVVDGARAAQFMGTLVAYVEEPLILFD